MIDIIIPAYNAHKTIGKTLCSIMLQSRRDLVNVYIVNDCSSTDYQEFVKKYQKYFNIEELDIPQNVGPGGARNYGMKHSKGEYIIFIDSDDIFYNHYSIERLYSGIQIHNYDVCTSNFYEVSKNKCNYVHLNKKIWTHGKIYRRKFIEDNKLEFSNTRANEDLYFNFLVFLLKPKERYLDTITYVWQYNNESITRKNNHAYNYLALDEYNKNISLVVSKALELNISDDKIAAVFFFGMLEMYYMYLNASSKTVKKIIESSRENAINFKKYQKVLDEKVKNEVTQQIVAKFVDDNNMAKLLIPDISFKQFINEVISNA